MTDLDQQNVDRTEFAKLLVKYGELSADRDEWMVQHENLLAINRKLNETIAALRRGPPSGEMVMVLRRILWVKDHAGAREDNKLWDQPRQQRDMMYEIAKEALSAAEAEGRKG